MHQKPSCVARWATLMPSPDPFAVEVHFVPLPDSESRSADGVCVRSCCEEPFESCSIIPCETGSRNLRTSAKMKTNKHKNLLLARDRRTVHSRDLVHRFDYSPGTARSYLSHLGRQGLLERVNGHYELTKKGRERVCYFEICGCTHRSCPLCQGKMGVLTCPKCGTHIFRAIINHAERINSHSDSIRVIS